MLNIIKLVTHIKRSAARCGWYASAAHISAEAKRRGMTAECLNRWVEVDGIIATLIDHGSSLAGDGWTFNDVPELDIRRNRSLRKAFHRAMAERAEREEMMNEPGYSAENPFPLEDWEL